MLNAALMMKLVLLDPDTTRNEHLNGLSSVRLNITVNKKLSDLCRLVMLCSFCFVGDLQGAGDAGMDVQDRELSRQWLSKSHQLAAHIQPSGVYNQYELARLKLSQAMVYAAMGDAESTLNHLLFSSDTDMRHEWLSGGDGMVRQLLVGLEFYEIHRTLLRNLVQNDEVSLAFEYVGKLTAEQGRDGIYLELGEILAGPEKLPLSLPGNLTGKERAQLEIGMLQGMLADGRDKEARALFQAMVPADRAIALNAQITILSMSGRWQAVAEVLSLAVALGEANERVLQNAVGMSIQAGQPEVALKLLERVPPSPSSESLSAQVAIGFASAGQEAIARQMLPAVKDKLSTSWEQVGLLVSADDWLEKYYQTIKDPWRRSERLIQMSKRLLSSGDEKAALIIAQRAEQAAAEITRPPTQALAYQLLTEVYALVGKAQVVERLLANTNTEERARLKAEAQLVKAWGVAGEPGKVLAVASGIEDPVTRVDALILAAAEFSRKSSDQQHYQTLVLAAQKVARSIANERTRASAWKSIAVLQLSSDDLEGALATAALAADKGASSGVYETIISHQLENEDFEGAIKTSSLIPDSPDARESEPSTRDRNTGRIVVAKAAAGEGKAAADLLEEISHKAIRELNTPPVIRALVAEGSQSRATELMAGLSRSDVRADALSIVLWVSAEARQLPSPAIFQFVPRRGGAGLCWAAAAASESDSESLQRWLASIEHPICRAYAFAGAAYSLVGSAEALQPTTIFAFVDPQKTTERMAIAMQRQAAFSR